MRHDQEANAKLFWSHNKDKKTVYRGLEPEPLLVSEGAEGLLNDGE